MRQKTTAQALLPPEGGVPVGESIGLVTGATTESPPPVGPKGLFVEKLRSAPVHG